MERINWILVLLCLGNLILWGVSGFEEPRDSPEKLREKISQFEKDIPELEKISAWTKRSQVLLNAIPGENAKVFINRIQALAKAWKFTLQETSQNGDYPVYMNLSGVGSYKATASLLGEIGKTSTVVVNKLSLMVQDDLLINAHMEMIIRTGPWRGSNTSLQPIEPLQEVNLPINIGRTDLFGHEAPQEKPVIGTPNIRYLGFYSGKDRPTGIIEENMKSMLVQLGDRTPSGLRIENITPDFLEVRVNSERGKEWKIHLEKSR